MERTASLLQAFNPDAPAIVVPERDGRCGDPVLWPRRYFAELCAVSDDAVPGGLLDCHADKVKLIRITGDSYLVDADTPDTPSRLLTA